MPGFNGSGPLGQGPATGRGMGFCGSGVNAPTGAYGQGMAFGRGMGRGKGRSMGGGFGMQGGRVNYGFMPANYDVDAYESYLENELKQVKASRGLIDKD